MRNFSCHPTFHRFNTVGDQEDLRYILEKIQRRYPQQSLYGVGISAGSSLLARYLGGEFSAVRQPDLRKAGLSSRVGVEIGQKRL
jgi:predicted alpha/beta-fold hydrolase